MIANHCQSEQHEEFLSVGERPFDKLRVTN